MDDIDWKAKAQAAEQALSDLKREVLEKVGKEIGWQDIRLVAGEGKLSLNHTLMAANAVIRQRIRALTSLCDKLSSIGGEG